jgi:hypothetical protein
MERANRAGDTTFVRRKFTLPESLDTVLVGFAEDHYQGNVSLCLRAAIEDHRATLNGKKNELILQQVTRQLNDFQEQQAEIQAIVTNLELNNDTPTSDCDQIRLAIHQNMTDDMQQVHLALIDATDPLRIADLSEELNIPSVCLEPILGRMVDHGYVTPYGTNPQRFSLAGTHTGETK